jgi:hypothetical protein
MGKTFSIVLAVGMAVALAQPGFAQVERRTAKNDERSAAVSVEAATITATVVAIDYQNRTGTLKLSDGRTETFMAGPEATGFDQARVGDQVLIRK